MTTVISSHLGYPRIGENREWKKTLERFWSGKINKDTFLQDIEELRLHHLQKQKDQNIDLIPVGDFSLYDHVLDTSVMFGVIPERFEYSGGPVPLETYFAIARGNQKAVASEMTKWFNTNYHYIVPELGGAEPKITENRPLKFYREAKEKLGISGKPVILGPITYLKLSKGYKPEEFQALLNKFVPLYITILQELEKEGVEWVQIDEPILATSLEAQDIDIFKETYEAFSSSLTDLNILLQTYFEGLDHYQEVVSLPVQGIGIDFIHDEGANWASIKKYGFPKDKVLAAGIIDGRNIWRSNLKEKLEWLQEIVETTRVETLFVQPSSSLLHVPVTVKNESKLSSTLANALSFADEKLEEIALLTKGLCQGASAIENEINESIAAVEAINESISRNVPQVRDAIRNLSGFSSKRNASFKERYKIQLQEFQLPLLPTTTIGSLPQTPEVRKARRAWKSGEWSNEEYDRFVKEQMDEGIKLQEEIGLDVLVHGEFERNDMVEYFGEKLGGFETSSNGWVQSYGSRCVKPPLIYGDVHFIKPITVKESVYAQSLTNKPVKGMLTGPQTILNWSFVRDDIPRHEVAYQIALALRKEVETLEAEGIKMIQVDEPALREGLPLKQNKWEAYLEKAVYAFRLATSSVKDSTQIHTHMCYSEFDDIIDTISALDADVISIEAARSHGEIIRTFEEKVYDKGIGLGVYDIHSPRIPEVKEIEDILKRALQVLDPELFWINPDCGLKTRKKDEVAASLKSMVEAAKKIREQLAVSKA
ncbi:5-methyltetrahydropteroyltriglutamate--homocysteine methyltransferase [Scopulibacillus daqui]|uniref:5-methyltetrahydropteroyltriglutamate--homocysteine methyltransferase n=1 Tax=Scopulibacillus daqui TaxID=1469162 RepID=A0ABS2Q3E2_9BACL|nr:5-methyltetrahydropteroyltriglutamate--homocysteine S-methyltransferase [Scopulibacillus daqui]MBM7646816.1 5-methyltetrahydropteroyltriglutamate--homocysteine methyltransferase [Scopulibacillus daqui]